MRHLWLAVGILLLIFAGSIVNGFWIGKNTSGLIELLNQSERSIEDGDWEHAKETTLEAYEKWTSISTYLHIVLRHNEINSAEKSFKEVLAFIDTEDIEEYSASNASLISQLILLDEMEQLNIKNLLAVTCPQAAY